MFTGFGYDSIINSDIVIREFEISINQNKLNSAIIFIDGLIDSRIINNSVLHPLMAHHSINKSTNIKNFILKKLISQTDTKLENLTQEVRRHTDFAMKIPVIEQRLGTCESDIKELKEVKNG